MPPHEGKRDVTKSKSWAHTWIHCGAPVRGGVLPAGEQAVQAHDTVEQVVQVERLNAGAYRMRIRPEKKR